MEQAKHKQILARDIMTKKVISVLPETQIVDAARIISEHNFDGLPVITENNNLVGILTEYDLITKTSSLSASFLQKILADVYTVKEETDSADSKRISELTVKDIMNSEPLTLKEDVPFEEIVETFRIHHRVNPILIVNEVNQIVGIVSRFDVLRPLNILGYGNKK